MAPEVTTDTATILIVDDEEPIRQALHRVLDKLGHEVFVAANGEEALELLREGQTIEVMLLDVRMPGMTGFDVVTEALEIDRRAQRAPDQSLDFDGPSVHVPAAAPVARLPAPGGRWEHGVLGGEPAATAAFEPARDPVYDGDRTNDAGFAERGEAGTGGAADESALEPHWPEIVRFTPVGSHELIPRCPSQVLPQTGFEERHRGAGK